MPSAAARPLLPQSPASDARCSGACASAFAATSSGPAVDASGDDGLGGEFAQHQPQLLPGRP
ncbi:MAG: hypothetical protein MZU91_04800 [Desulfosudis oleivorans]|nr:hypothetical protein [Desulfosudis oleivorans]